VRPVRVRGGHRHSPLLITCEHASYELPPEYGALGLRPQDLRDHVGWDIGAAAVARALAEAFDAPLVESGYSRLLIDCNRDLGDHDLIVAESHGVAVPGNDALAESEREKRVREFYHPFHDAIDDVAAGRDQALLFSVHSFTPELRGSRRDFDVGVLYDEHEERAALLAQALAGQRLRVRHNEPYSGLDGLIFSARSHGQRHGAPYLEIEVNNALLRSDSGAQEVASRIAAALREVL